MQGGPAEKLHQDNTDQGSQAVEAYVCICGSPSGDKRLMILIQAGKSHTDDPCQKEQSQSAYPVYIQRERDGDGQKAVFRHMGGFPDIIVDFLSLICQFFITFVRIEKLVFRFHDLIADLVA